MYKEVNNTLFISHLSKQYDKLKNYTPKVATDSNLVAVIVECRPLPYLITVIKTVMYYLGDKWSLQIFHGLEHEDELKGEMKNWGSIHFENMGTDNITKVEYNNLLKSPDFWKKVKGEKVAKDKGIACETEEDVFKALGLPYKTPAERDI
jgi:hypothetical protein